MFWMKIRQGKGGEIKSSECAAALMEEEFTRAIVNWMNGRGRKREREWGKTDLHFAVKNCCLYVDRTKH